ncbi:hypothetical protein LCGC14_2822360 [marine sediment metagenome]|uniref:Uncharacterized protein n=1 Tax=marine sediment metagenome TaxID=412755 RepID=A0A0F8YGM2_9ZZZZ
MKLCFCTFCFCSNGILKEQDVCYPCANGVHKIKRPVDLSIWEKAFAKSEILGKRSYDDDLC